MNRSSVPINAKSILLIALLIALAGGLIAPKLALAGDQHSSTPITCLAIETLNGIHCAEGAATVGKCQTVGEITLCRVDDPEALPLWYSWYNPALGGTNCGGSCDYMATMPVTPAAYEFAASCPRGWTFYGRTRTITTPAGLRECVDHGTDIKPTWREAYGPAGLGWHWVIVVDILAHERPDWAYTMSGEWSLGWSE